MRLSWKEERVFECTRAPVIKLNDPGGMAISSTFNPSNYHCLLTIFSYKFEIKILTQFCWEIKLIFHFYFYFHFLLILFIIIFQFIAHKNDMLGDP